MSVDEDQAAYEKFLVDNHVVFPPTVTLAKKSAGRVRNSMFPETFLIDRRRPSARKIVGPQDWQSPEVMVPRYSADQSEPCFMVCSYFRPHTRPVAGH